MRVVARVERAFAIQLPLLTIFTTPVLADLAAEVETRVVADVDALTEEEAALLLQDEVTWR